MSLPLDCQQDGPCATPPGCLRHWAERVREVLAECERVVGRPIPVTVAARREGDPPELLSDPARIMRELRWTPRHVTLAPMVESAWSWMQANPNGYRR